MPGGDRTGPLGMGPMTGRGAGFCAGYGMPGYMNPGYGYGRGFGAGFGRGRGFGGRGFGRRNWFYATGQPGWVRSGWNPNPWYPAPQPYQASDPELEKQALKDQAVALQAELESIKKRLSEIESKADEE